MHIEYLESLLYRGCRCYSRSVIGDSLSIIPKILEKLDNSKISYVRIWRYERKIEGHANKDFLKKFYLLINKMLNGNWSYVEIEKRNNAVKLIVGNNRKESLVEIKKGYIKFHWNVGEATYNVVTFDKIKKWLREVNIRFDFSGKCLKVKYFLLSLYIIYLYLQSITSNSLNVNSN